VSAETCRSCGAPVLWRRSEGFGRWAPIDAEPNPAGNVLLLSEGRYRVLGPPSLLEPEPPGLRYMPHVATSPHAPGWRAGRSEASGAPGDAEA
jgi:hypothetical protein